MPFRKPYILAITVSVLILHSILLGQLPSQLPDDKKEQAEEYLQWIQKYHAENNRTQETNFLNKLAYLCWEYNANTEAIYYFQQSLKINEDIDNQNAIQAICTNLGTLYTDIGQYHKAQDQYNRALLVNRRLNRKQGIIGNLLNLANVKMLQQEYNNAINYLENALDMSKEINNLRFIRQCYGMLGEANERLGNSKKAIEYNGLFLTYDQYIKNEEMNQMQEESQNKIDQAQAEKRATEYQLYQRTDELKSTQDSLKHSEEEIVLMQELNEAKEATLREQQEKLKIEKRIRWISIVGLVILLFYSFIVYQQLKQKRKANSLLERQNEEILRQKSEIVSQKKILEEQNAHIEAGMHYAKNIQQAVLPIPDEIKKHLDCFIIYKPKEIVSGDFYWFSGLEEANENELFIAVADCTGHGVPGAFMSLIGSRLISELVNERRIHDPAKILENLNHQIKKALRQHETDNDDGMDLCFCKIEKLNNDQTKVTFSGAKRPLFYYLQAKKELGTLKGARKSLGGIVPEWDQTEFTNQEILLTKGDFVYLTSDGFVDQDSPEAVKLGTKYLLQLLEKIAFLPPLEQKAELEKQLEIFMAGNYQVDDITILGIRIT